MRWNLDPAQALSLGNYGEISGNCNDDKRILHVLNRLSYGPT